MLLNRTGHLWQNPSDLLAVPRHAVQFVVLAPDLLMQKARTLLFAEYSTRLVPSLFWYRCLLVELALPGEVLAAADRALRTGWRVLEGRSLTRQVFHAPVTRRVLAIWIGL